MVKVTIIVPVYNTEKYLDRCLNSISSQSYDNLEVILVDDGSTDSSGKICDDFCKKDIRFRVYHITNGGPSRARNLGLSIMTGDYVLFVDSDDWVDEHFVSHYLCTNFQKYDAVFSMWDIETKNGIINPSNLVSPYEGTDFAKGVIELSGKFAFELNCNKMLRSDIIKKHSIRFPEGIHSNEDDIFTYEYAKYIRNFIVLNEAHYHEVYVDDFDRHLSAKILPVDVIYSTNMLAVKSALKISSSKLWKQYQNERLFYRLGAAIMKNIVKHTDSKYIMPYIDIAVSLKREYGASLVNKHRKGYVVWKITYDMVFAFKNFYYVKVLSLLVSLGKKI